MNLTDVKLVVDPGINFSSNPLYLILKGGAKRLVTRPVLKKKQPDLYAHCRNPLLTDGFVVVNDKAYKLLPGANYLAGKRKNKPVVKPIPKGTLIVKLIHPNVLSPEQRKKMVGLGEKGEWRRQFVEEGLTGTEQMHRAREHTAVEEAAWAKKTRAKKRERRKKMEKRTDNEVGPTEESVPSDAIYGAADVAKLAKLEPTLIRRFLRNRGVGKRGGRYLFKKSEAEKIARAAKKHYGEE